MLKLIENPGMAVCIAQHVSLQGLFFLGMTPAYLPQHNRKMGGEQRGDESQIQVTTQDILGNTVGGQTLSMVGGREMCPGACQLVWV